MGVQFTPCNGSHVSLNGTTSSTTVAVPTADEGNTFKIANGGPAVAHVSINTAASLGDMGIISGEVVYVPVNETQANIAMITSASTATIEVTRGYATYGR